MGTATKKEGLKILYVGNFAKISVGEPEIAKALEKGGHKVTKIGESKTDTRKLKDEIDRGDYDFLLFAKFRVGTTDEVRAFLKMCPIPTVCWLFDLYWGYKREGRLRLGGDPCFLANMVFTTDGGHNENWERHHIKHKLLRQGIDGNVKMGRPVYPTKAEIGFIGSTNTAGWAYRGELLKWLHTTYGDRFGHFGEHGNIRHKELDELLATLKVVIGDSVNSPFYWSNRVYEMVGRGAFLIHPKVRGLEEEFQYYKHFVPYKYGDYAGLKEKIDYYLENTRERNKIRNAGYEYCHEHHTYRHRTDKLIEHVKCELLKKN